MKILTRSCGLFFAVVSVAVAAQTPQPVQPKQLKLENMAATMGVTPLATGGSLQRIPLPAELMMHSQSPTLADLRLFNAKGEPMPFAVRGTATESTAVTSNKITLKAIPIRKEGNTIRAGNTSVQIKNGVAEIKVLVEAPSVTGGKNDASKTTKGIDAGRLLDTRKVEGVLTAISFDIDLPANTVVPITLEASRDFVNWETLASAKSVYRFSDVGSANTSEEAPQLTSIELLNSQNGGEIKDRYLRVTWPAQTNFGVELRSATLTMETSKRVPIAQPKRPLGAPSATATHSQEWQLASPLRLRALALTTDELGTLMPLTILGRDGDKDDKQPWRILATTVLFKLDLPSADAGKRMTSTNAPVMLNGASVRQLKIEAAPSSAGIAANLITAAIEYEAQEIIAAIKPADNITVAVGAKNAASIALPLQTLVPDISIQRLLQLGLVGESDAVKFYPERLLAIAPTQPMDNKRMVLWAALVLGVGVLGAMAWATMRQLKGAKPAAEGDKRNDG